MYEKLTAKVLNYAFGKFNDYPRQITFYDVNGCGEACFWLNNSYHTLNIEAGLVGLNYNVKSVSYYLQPPDNLFSGDVTYKALEVGKQPRKTTVSYRDLTSQYEQGGYTYVQHLRDFGYDALAIGIYKYYYSQHNFLGYFIQHKQNGLVFWNANSMLGLHSTHIVFRPQGSYIQLQQETNPPEILVTDMASIKRLATKGENSDYIINKW